MIESGFRQFLKKAGKKLHVVDDLIMQVHRFETFLTSNPRVGLDTAGRQELQDYVKILAPSEARKQLRGLALYYHFTGNNSLAELASTIREQAIAQTRCWASTDLEADGATLLAHIAQRWDIEVLFADVKELLGIDQYQLMSAEAIRRFWVLVMVAYGFLEQERARLKRQQGRHVTIGDAARHVQRVHWAHCLTWLHEQIVVHHVSAADLQARLLV